MPQIYHKRGAPPRCFSQSHTEHARFLLHCSMLGIGGHRFFSALTNSVLPSGAIATAVMVL
jgi:hypothetical protein